MEHDTLVRAWWMPALRGAAGVAFGLLVLAWPRCGLVWLAGLFGGYAVAGGLVWVTGALRHRRHDARWRAPLFIGLVGMGMGGLCLAHPVPTTLVLVLLIGVHALATGLLDLAAALRLRTCLEGERLLALSALASIGFGLAVALAPHTGAAAAGPLVGVYALASGVALLGLSARVRAAMRPCRGVSPVGRGESAGGLR